MDTDVTTAENAERKKAAAGQINHRGAMKRSAAKSQPKGQNEEPRNTRITRKRAGKTFALLSACSAYSAV